VSTGKSSDSDDSFPASFEVIPPKQSSDVMLQVGLGSIL
jgi:hypothetical protein